MLGSLLEPYNSLAVVHLYANALIIAEAQVALCPGVPLLGGLTVELGGALLALLHPGTHLVAQTKFTDGREVVLICGRSNQLQSPGDIRFRSDAPQEAHPQLVLGGDVVTVCGTLEPLKGKLRILGGATAIGVAEGHLIGGFQIALLGGGQQLLKVGRLLGGYVR